MGSSSSKFSLRLHHRENPRLTTTPDIFFLNPLALDPGIGRPLRFIPNVALSTRSAFAILGLSSSNVFFVAQTSQ
jgi:hypothetical protein